MAATQEFPHDYFLGTLVRLLDTIKYRDSNYTREQRIENLHYSYAHAAKHFAQPHVQKTLKADPKRIEASLRTIVGMCVYSWTKVSKELMADLSVHYTYTLILDDSTDDPYPNMLTFFDDLANGRQQKHPWWQLVNDHFPQVLRHFGPFCSLNLIRSTLDFFEGCWVEQYQFHGYPGSHDYPLFLRRLNGLGHCVGASLWPKDQFDEQKLFLEITSAIAQMENWMVFVNDLMSFYKEFDDARDQTSLVKNYCETEGITLDQALEKLTRDTLHCCEQMMAVFPDKDPSLMETIECFMHGYVTWHLCDKRYRLSEVFERTTGDSDVEVQFRKFYNQANKVGGIAAEEWAYPTVAELVAEREKASEESKVIEPESVKESEAPQQPEVATQPEVEQQPETVKQPEVTSQPQVAEQPEVSKQPEVVIKPETVEQSEIAKQPEVPTQHEVVEQHESSKQPEVATQAGSAEQSGVVEQPQIVPQPEILKQQEVATQPEVVEHPEIVKQPEMIKQPGMVY